MNHIIIIFLPILFFSLTVDSFSNRFYVIEYRPTAKICKREGSFRYPTDCKKFYRCVDWSHDGKHFSIFHFSCPGETIFDEEIQVCNHPWKTEPCKIEIISQPGPPITVSPFPTRPPSGSLDTSDPTSMGSIESSSIGSTGSLEPSDPSSSVPNQSSSTSGSIDPSDSSQTESNESSSTGISGSDTIVAGGAGSDNAGAIEGLLPTGPMSGSSEDIGGDKLMTGVILDGENPQTESLLVPINGDNGSQTADQLVPIPPFNPIDGTGGIPENPTEVIYPVFLPFPGPDGLPPLDPGLGPVLPLPPPISIIPTQPDTSPGSDGSFIGQDQTTEIHSPDNGGTGSSGMTSGGLGSGQTSDMQSDNPNSQEQSTVSSGSTPSGSSPEIVSTESNQSQGSTGPNQSQGSTGPNQSQGSMGSNQSQGSMGANQSQVSTGSDQSQGSMGANQSQVSTGSDQSQDSTEASQSQVSTGSSQSQGSTSSSQSQGQTGSSQSQGSVGSSQSQGSMGSSQSQGSTGSSQSQDPTGSNQSQGSTGSSQSQEPTGSNQSQGSSGLNESQSSTSSTGILQGSSNQNSSSSSAQSSSSQNEGTDIATSASSQVSSGVGDASNLEQNVNISANGTTGKYMVMDGSIFECLKPGFFPFEGNCLDFYVCLEILPGVLLSDQLYRCPKRYLFDEVTQRCQREAKVNCTKFSVDTVAPYAKETVVVVLEQFLEEFFNTPLHYRTNLVG